MLTAFCPATHRTGSDFFTFFRLRRFRSEPELPDQNNQRDSQQQEQQNPERQTEMPGQKTKELGDKGFHRTTDAPAS